jgi:predicted dehydrogenase
MNEQTQSPSLSRRVFLTGATAAASLTALKSGAARAAQANSNIELGLIGCGGRGKWLASLFRQVEGVKIVALADYFQDRVDQACGALGVEPSRCYTGLSAYKRLLEGKLDAVAIETPPYFHPEQAAAAVDAGKHVYLAKPIAVDVPGCQTILESGRKATERKLCFLVDFQTRNQPIFREAARRVHAGDIGRPVCGQANYHAGRLGRQADPGTAEARLRNWVFDIALSGDIIVEQNIHALDVLTWFLDAAPQRAAGTGGRKARIDVGDCWDHFVVTYWFPDDVIIDFGSTQFAKGYSDICCRLYGTNGTVDSHYGGEVTIKGDTPYEGGGTGNIYQEGAANNMTDFQRLVAEGKFDNETVPASVRSNLTAILGRLAAYGGREVTWAEMLKANEKLDGKLEGLKA